MVNDELIKKFEESYYELSEHDMNEFVGVDLGEGNYIDIVKSQQEENGVLIINYIYNDEIIKTSPFSKQYVIESLIELSYYPEAKLKEMASHTEINRKRKSLIEEIKKDIYIIDKEFKPLRDKISLYVKLYGEDNIEDQISLFVLKRDMDYIYRKLNGEND